MSLTFTLVSFTCTAAFIGSLLVYAQFGSKFWPTIGMLSFSTAFAFPFFFLALFPQYLSKLPKSGGWLNSVKVIMGFLELAAAFKFLSNTDLVMKWGLFTRDSVLAIWSFIFMLMALYILGKISMPFDSKVNSLSKRRIILGIGTLMFGLYLGLGLSSNFKINGLIESYLPPPTIENTHNESDGWLLNLDDAYIKASKENMPIFIDFTGYTCTNCRWMEINIFPLPEVKKLLNDNFILVKLYTDGKEEIHKKNKELEKQRFGTVALPYYVVLSPSDNELGTFPGMDPNKDNFIDFLNESYNKFLDE
jgi:thiol:disulfide interchange protein DsbD